MRLFAETTHVAQGCRSVSQIRAKAREGAQKVTGGEGRGGEGVQSQGEGNAANNRSQVQAAWGHGGLGSAAAAGQTTWRGRSHDDDDRSLVRGQWWDEALERRSFAAWRCVCLEPSALPCAEPRE